jgi:hypothetical protein
MKSTLILALVLAIIAIALLGGSVSGFSEGNMGGPAVMLFIGVIFGMGAGVNFKGFFAEKESDGFLKKCCAKTVEVIDRVLAVGDEENVINNRTFSQDDIRMIVMDHQRQCAMIMTGDCIYEKNAQSYRGVKSGLRDVKFVVGSEYRPTKRELVDVESYARMGYAAGGLGVAAMNASDAIKMNAEGGWLTSGGPYYPVNIMSAGRSSGANVVIIRNDLLNEFGIPYMYANKKTGRWFTAFYIRLDNQATAAKCAKELTKYMRTVAVASK